MLKGKKVLLGITASIAAYKTANLVRLFKKEGALVRVIQTEASLAFVTPLTLATLAETEVLSKMIDDESEQWNSHVELGLWADFMLIAPTTAKTMAKMVSGLCDNLLLATYLSARCPVYYAPAMDLDMYQHPSTKENIDKLHAFGNRLIPAAFGELASGLVGEGRMAEPEEIVAFIIDDLNKQLSLKGKRALVTSGPTHEPIDPIRFISNRSSGKMGLSIAQELANRGAEVDVILGPSSMEVVHSNIKVHHVETANQMHEQVEKLFSAADIAIFAAAVADYTPDIVQKQKIKKSTSDWNINLRKTKDTLQEMSKQKKDHQFVIGFALETENELANAHDKLIKKNLDMIVLNSLRDKGAGFQHNTNKITIIDKARNSYNFELKHKDEVAKDIIDKIIELS